MSPIYLAAPQDQHGGPDGQGRNRMSVGAIGVGSQCALQPNSYPALIESLDTRRARWGGFGACTREGRCGECPILGAAKLGLRALTDRVLVRVAATGRPYIMNKPEDGWASNAIHWSWTQLSRLEGWSVGDSYSDQRSEGFWLIREEPA